MRQERVHRPARAPDRARTERETEQDRQERPEVRKDVWERWFQERGAQ
jgi:hypothetical protein